VLPIPLELVLVVGHLRPPSVRSPGDRNVRCDRGPDRDVNGGEGRPRLLEVRREGAMFKVMILIKRRPDISMDEFIDYYENHHAPLARRIVRNMKGYTRRYLTPLGEGELPYDVATEIVRRRGGL
jgi:hypothetical protein